MSKTIEPTPRPWSVEKNNHRMRIVHRVGEPGQPGFKYRHVTRDWLEQKSGAKRGTSPNWYGFTAQEEMDSALIVRAVNSHERLLSLLSTCAAYLAQGDMEVTSRSIDGEAFKAELLAAVNEAQRGDGTEVQS